MGRACFLLLNWLRDWLSWKPAGAACGGGSKPGRSESGVNSIGRTHSGTSKSMKSGGVWPAGQSQIRGHRLDPLSLGNG